MADDRFSSANLRCDDEDLSSLEAVLGIAQEEQQPLRIAEQEQEEEPFDIVEEEQFVQIMINKEITFNFGNSVSNTLIQFLRPQAVSWMFIYTDTLGLLTQTAYLSIAYFDRFVLQRTSRNETIGEVLLVSAACLSLAAKLEQRKAPRLAYYNLDDTGYDSVQIGRMERLVFQTLGWNLILVTPFHYLRYFIFQFSQQTSSIEMVSTTEGLILGLIRDTSFMSYRPSVVAAAATLLALDQNLTRFTMEARINSVSSSRFLQIEQVFRCYNMIKNLRRDVTSSNTGALGTKRIRLH
ncbi:cyclin d5 1 [Euphorbia peplus]|nr:cyclin d5 1 [Euphorbia peplus]